MKCFVRVLSLVAICVVLLCAAVSAAPADATKRYELRVDQTGAGGVFCLDAETAFWEYPLLEAGQCRTDGKLTFTNYSDVAVDTGIVITLPYDNEVALAYLNYVRICVVRDDGAVVYDGPYCRIADNGRLDDGYMCAPGAAVTYTVSAWCAYDYAGKAAEDSSGITWQLAVSDHKEEPDGRPTPSTPSEVWVLGVLAVGIAVLVVCLLPRFKRKSNRSRRKNR